MGITADGNVRDSSHQHRQVEPAHDWAPDVWAMMYQRLPSSNCVHFIWISTKKKKKKMSHCIVQELWLKHNVMVDFISFVLYSEIRQ